MNNHNFNKVVNSALSLCAHPESDTLTLHVWILEEPCFPLCCRWYDNPLRETSAQIQTDAKPGNDSVPSSALRRGLAQAQVRRVGPGIAKRRCGCFILPRQVALALVLVSYPDPSRPVTSFCVLCS